MIALIRWDQASFGVPLSVSLALFQLSPTNILAFVCHDNGLGCRVVGIVFFAIARKLLYSNKNNNSEYK